MSITLYQFSPSPFTEKVARALNYKGLEFTRQEIVGGTADQYKHISANGKFPAISHNDHAVQDSSNILVYLDEIQPDPSIIPMEPAYQAYAHVIEEWADESLYFFEIVTTIMWEHNLKSRIHTFMPTFEGSGLTPEQVMPMMKDIMSPIAMAQGAGRKSKDQIIAELEQHFRTLNSLLNGSIFLVGNALCNADLAVMGQLGALKYSQEVQDIMQQYPAIDEWIERINEIAPND